MDEQSVTARRGPAIAALGLALAVAAVSSACAKQHDRAAATVEGDQQTAHVELVDNAFRPVTIGAKGDVRLVLHLNNEGLQHHTFTDESSGVDVELGPGEKRTVTIPPLPAEETRYFLCRFHEANGMKGKVSFVETL